MRTYRITTAIVISLSWLLTIGCVNDYPELVPAAALFAGSSNAIEETTDPGTTTTPAALTITSTTPGNFTILDPLQTIEIQFSGNIQTGSCTVSGSATLSGAAQPVVFSSPNTIQISPTANWAEGDQTMVIDNCLDESGLATQRPFLYFRVVPPAKVRYVATTGNDLNDGETPATAMQSITVARSDLTADGCVTNCTVLVAAGTYGATDMSTPDVSIFGSYSADFSSSSPASYSSIIQDTGICSSPNYSLYSAAISANTVIRGFEVRANPNCGNSTAIRLLNSDVRLEFVRAIGPTCTGTTATGSGILIGGGSPVIAQSIINGGDCSSGLAAPNYAGVRIAGTATSLTVLSSAVNGGTASSVGSRTKGIDMLIDSNTITTSFVTIDGGTSDTTAGITGSNWTGVMNQSRILGGTANGTGVLDTATALEVTGGNVIIRNSIIGGGVSNAAGADAMGVLCNGGANLMLQHNTIVGGAALSTGSSIAVKIGLVTACNLTFDNNIISTIDGIAPLNDPVCLRESFTSTITSIRHNNFFNCGVAYRTVADTDYPVLCGGGGSFGQTTGCFTTIEPTGGMMTANISADPQFANFAEPFDLALTENTPCTVAEGGFDPGYPANFLFGIQGNARTAPFSIGAFEYDGTCVP